MTAVRSVRHPGRALAAVAVVAALAVLIGLAGTGTARAEGVVPFPMIPKAAPGTTCVKDPEVMRRTHMDLLKHQRDDTLRMGVRGTDSQLQECLSCHAVKDASTGQPVTADSSQHFCVACHEYAAVSVDCWQCHASVPKGTGAQAAR